MQARDFGNAAEENLSGQLASAASLNATTGRLLSV